MVPDPVFRPVPKAAACSRQERDHDRCRVRIGQGWAADRTCLKSPAGGHCLSGCRLPKEPTPLVPALPIGFWRKASNSRCRAAMMPPCNAILRRSTLSGIQIRQACHSMVEMATFGWGRVMRVCFAVSCRVESVSCRSWVFTRGITSRGTGLPPDSAHAPQRGEAQAGNAELSAPRATARSHAMFAALTNEVMLGLTLAIAHRWPDRRRGQVASALLMQQHGELECGRSQSQCRDFCGL